MSQQLLIDGSRPDQTQFALIGDNGLDDFEYESKLKKNQKGNIYLGKVSRIEASLQAAFVDIGNERNAFLAFGEIHPNYFQIPIADRDALIVQRTAGPLRLSTYAPPTDEERAARTTYEWNEDGKSWDKVVI